jgi:RNA polymerase sigma factor (sigma-70 family)
MNEQERAEQVDLATKGDTDALQRLIVHYHTPLRTSLQAKMDPALRQHIDPEDVLQEAYAAAFKTITGCNFDTPAGFYKWLEKITVNELKDQQRDLHRHKRDIARRVRPPADMPTSYPDLIQTLASPDSTPSRHVAAEEAVAAVLTSLARLTDDQRNVVRLRFLESRPIRHLGSPASGHQARTSPADCLSRSNNPQNTKNRPKMSQLPPPHWRIRSGGG